MSSNDNSFDLISVRPASQDVRKRDGGSASDASLPDGHARNVSCQMTVAQLPDVSSQGLHHLCSSFIAEVVDDFDLIGAWRRLVIRQDDDGEDCSVGVSSRSRSGESATRTEPALLGGHPETGNVQQRHGQHRCSCRFKSRRRHSESTEAVECAL